MLFANGYDFLESVQLVDLMTNKSCRSFAQYPLRVRQAAGGLLQGKPLICGGRHSYTANTKGAVSACYLHNSSINDWVHFTSLHTSRSRHASASVEGALWMTGGLDSGHKRLKSTEFVHGNGSVLQGPDLPSPRSGHCMVDLKDGRVMIIGGTPTFKEVLIYHQSNRSFVHAANLSNGRSSFACALFNSAMHGFRPVILVAGGAYASVYAVNSVEVLDFTKTPTLWQHSEFFLFLIFK